MSESKKPEPDGVAEGGAPFKADLEADHWAIARVRLEEHERTGAGTLSVEQVGRFLRQEIERLRAEKA